MISKIVSPSPKRATPVDHHVATRIRARHLEIGMTQFELANQLGIAYQQVSKYTTARDRITAGRLHQIAGILDVPVAYFFEGL